MSKEQQILQAWKDLKARVNDVEKHIKEQIIPNMYSSFLIDLAGMTLKEYHPAGMKVKENADYAIRILSGSGTVHKLDPAKKYQVDLGKPLVKLLSPCLMPSVGFREDLTDQDFDQFADRWAVEGWGNFMRLFVAGSWEPKLKL